MWRRFYCILCFLAFAIIISTIPMPKVVVAIDCKNMLKPVKPEHCCRLPELFQGNLLDICKRFHGRSSQCFYDCVFSRAEICRQGKCNRSKADDYIDWIMTPQHAFVGSIKSAYEKCIRKANDMRMNMVQRFDSVGCNPLPEMIYLCVKNEVFLSCPPAYWIDDDADCDKNREFIAKCVRHNS